MAPRSKIEWTDATWNPITGCTLVSEGCRNCYAARLAATRLQHHPSRAGLARLNAAGEAKFTGEVRFNEKWLDQPLRWKKPKRIFVCAHGDLFHEKVPDTWIDRVFAVMALAPQHTFQVLTKRPERMRDYMTADRRAVIASSVVAGSLPITRQEAFARISPSATPDLRWLFKTSTVSWPLPNVWLGVSAEDQATADTRIPPLLATPASVRFVSAEPLLGALDLTRVAERAGLDPHWCMKKAGLGWVIVGGESGPGARPMHPDWARSLRDQCAAAGVAFHFKQWGEWAPYDRGRFTFGHTDEPIQKFGKKLAGRLLDGAFHDGWPR